MTIEKEGERAREEGRQSLREGEGGREGGRETEVGRRSVWELACLFLKKEGEGASRAFNVC